MLARDRWLEILSRCVSPEVEPPIRRKSRRYGLRFGVVRLHYKEDGTPRTLTASLLQVSADGLMARSHTPIPLSIPVWIEVTLEDDTFALLGQVAHSTQTVGGYKIGIHLRFPEQE
ncbi:MAG: hypothetical protein ACE5I3_07365 [Phycisphaerae bacterium]